MRFFTVIMVILLGSSVTVLRTSLDQDAWKRALMLPAQVVRSVIQGVSPRQFAFVNSGTLLRLLPPDSACAYLAYQYIAHGSSDYNRLLAHQLDGWKALETFRSEGFLKYCARVCTILMSTDIFSYVPGTVCRVVHNEFLYIIGSGFFSSFLMASCVFSPILFPSIPAPSAP